MPKKRTPRNLDAGPLQGDIDLFELHLLSENKSPKTILTYLSAARWLAAEGLEVGEWSEVTTMDIKRWITRLVAKYSDSYANNQYRALQQFFRWFAEPPSRSRRVILISALTGSGNARGGLAWSRVRCGRCWLKWDSYSVRIVRRWCSFMMRIRSRILRRMLPTRCSVIAFIRGVRAAVSGTRIPGL